MKEHMPMMTKRRISNILKRMFDGDEYYTNMSPRITRAEIDYLRDLGFELQIDHTHGVHEGPIAVYPLHRDTFKERAAIWLKMPNAQKLSINEEGKHEK